ncbi:hypothetical protein E4U11_001131, partial [Claviceps purpurea]
DALRQFEAQFTQVRSPGIGKNIFSRLKPRNRNFGKNIFSRLPLEAKKLERRSGGLVYAHWLNFRQQKQDEEDMSKNEEVPDNIEGVWTERDDQDLRWADGVRAEELLLRAKAVQGTKRKDLSPRWDPVVRAAEGKRRRAKRKFNWLV